MNETAKPAAAASGDDLGLGKFPLCREPWESYYILRRGILPCCYGNPIIAPMADYAAAWNSAAAREIRGYLSRGKLSPYCLESLGCPIVQRVLAREAKAREEGRAAGEESALPPPRRRFFRFLNRLMFRVPGRIWRALGGR